MDGGVIFAIRLLSLDAVAMVLWSAEQTMTRLESNKNVKEEEDDE